MSTKMKLEYKITKSTLSEDELNVLGKDGWILTIYQDLSEEFIWAREYEEEFVDGFEKTETGLSEKDNLRV